MYKRICRLKQAPLTSQLPYGASLLSEYLVVLLQDQQAMLRQRGRTFISDELQAALQGGDVILTALGQQVVVPTTLGSRIFPIEEVRFPITWTQHPTSSFAEALLNNAMYSMDYLLVNMLASSKLAISPSYLYYLGPTVYSRRTDTATRRMSTAVTRIPREPYR